MRLNLNFKDATILRVSENEFKISFDMSTLNKPRLSRDARLYLEHFNLPEFIDEQNGRNKGELYGYFELRCDNINDGTDWDSEYGQSGSVILYQSPLNNFATFTNNDPMYIRNFKINQDFFTNKLTFTLRIYDRLGKPFVSSQFVDTEIDELHSTYLIYKTKIDELNVLNTSKLKNDTQLKLADENLLIAKDNFYLETKLLNDYLDDLNIELDKIITSKSTATTSVVERIKAELIKDIIGTNTMPNIIHLCEVYFKMAGVDNKKPYTALKTYIDNFYKTYINFIKSDLLYQQSRVFSNDMNSGKSVVWQDFSHTLTPDTILMKPIVLTGVNYKVTVAGGTDKTGKLDIHFFNSIEYSSKSSVFISNIIPDSGTDNILSKNNILTIDETRMANIVPDTFEYIFSKTDNAAILNVTVSAGTGSSASNPSRFLIKVKRNSGAYELEFPAVFKNVGFSKGNEILIKGSALGGDDGVSGDEKNDIKITIDSVIEYLKENLYDFPNYNDPKYSTDHGDFDIQIERDNNDLINPVGLADYDIKSYVLTRTKNYSAGEEIVIKGTALGGADGDDTNPNNDLTLVVGDVKLAEEVTTIDGVDTEYSIPKILIEGLVVKDSTDTDNGSALNYKIDVSSEDNEYIVALNRADGSSGFAVGDYILVKGSLLTGVDVTNDLRINIETVDGSGKILTLSASNTSRPRRPSFNDYKIKITTKINDTKYYAEIIDISNITQFVVGDRFKIEGDLLGGTNTTNDAFITIDTIVDDDINVIVTGTADSETGNVGEIKDISLKNGTGGVAFKETNVGEIKKSNISFTGTPIVTASLPKAKLDVTIESDLYYGDKYLDTLLTSKYNEILTAKNNLVYKGKTYFLTLDNQLEKIKCMNMSLVLYDEVPEYVSSSGHAITGNTYSRLNGCQSKRI